MKNFRILTFFLYPVLYFISPFPAMMILLIAALFNECIVSFLNMYIHRKGLELKNVHLHWKTCITTLIIIAFITLFFPGTSFIMINLLVGVGIAAMVISLCHCIKTYYRMLSQKVSVKRTSSTKGRICIILCALAIPVIVAACAVLPFLKQPEISEDYVQDFDVSSFYSDEESSERACVISQNGEALEERVRMIANATESIIMSTFDMRSDTSGRILLASLMEAANRGVHVNLLIDGFSHMNNVWGNPYFMALINTDNVTFKVYNPVNLFTPHTLMARMHDKYLIVDNSMYILGGRNCYDYFLGDQPGYKNYDWDILVYNPAPAEDSSVRSLLDYFDTVWNSSECIRLDSSILWRNNPAVIRCRNELNELYSELTTAHGNWLKPADYENITVETDKISLITNPIHTGAKEPTVFFAMTELMKNARHSVYFHTPYIICDDVMLNTLASVCDHVENVYMLTNSVANNGNPFGALDYLKYKEDILSTGIQILEYDAGVSYHGKCFTIDDTLSGIGSFNWDMRSAYIDTELMLIIDSPKINEQLRCAMETYEHQALFVTGLDTYNLPPDVIPQIISDKRKLRIDLLRLLPEWIRELM